MIYILVLWTAVAAGPFMADNQSGVKYDWRPIGEFQADSERKYTAREMCENAAQDLGLKTKNYRCVRSK